MKEEKGILGAVGEGHPTGLCTEAAEMRMRPVQTFSTLHSEHPSEPLSGQACRINE